MNEELLSIYNENELQKLCIKIDQYSKKSELDFHQIKILINHIINQPTGNVGEILLDSKIKIKFYHI